MKNALAVIVVSASVWAASCCGGPGNALEGPKSLLEGGARAGFRILGAGGELPKGMSLVSSDPAIAEVVVQPGADGQAVVKTNKAGKATLTLRDADAAILDVQEISVRAPAKLVARFVESETLGRAAAKEVVGLHIQAFDAEGVALAGSGLAQASFGGTGTRAEGVAIDGVERVFLTGSAGNATVHVAIGSLSVDAEIELVTPQVAVTHTRSVDGSEEVSIAVRDEKDRPLAGGKCAWTLTGGVTLVADASAADALENPAAARLATFTVPAGEGAAGATCLLGGQTSTVTFR